MLFNSVAFILFFILVLSVHYSNISWKFKKSSLLISSYLFYAAWNPSFVVLLLLSTIVDWFLAKKIYKSGSNITRKRWLWFSLLFNLGLLSVFKYSGFIFESFDLLMKFMGVTFEISNPGFILPMGISFYTFQTLSYTLDIYFKRLKPHHSFLDYALFVSFFPQLVAGPIVRAKDFLPQLKKQNRISFNVFSLGVSLFIIGLFEKTVLADALFAPIVNEVFDSDSPVDLLSAWLAGFLFYGQIFCDFSGYSLCAIGTAMCLGFNLPLNFRSPFAAIGFSDFWQRWHISLSSWLRDYLYLPLGGNRIGSFKTFRNLMLTMLLGGLWHGAAWTFVLWGFIHGFYLILERAIKSFAINNKILNTVAIKLTLMFLTMLLVMLAFVVFRAENLQQVNSIFSGMFGFSNGEPLVLWNLWTQICAFAFIALIAIQLTYKNRLLTDVIVGMNSFVKASLLATCLILLFISSGNSDAFIYFQF